MRAARTFVPVYRYDPVYECALRRVMPVITWLLAATALTIPVLIFMSLWPSVPAAERDRFLLLMAALVGLMLGASVMLFWLTRRMRRDAMETEWTLDNEGLSRKSGPTTERRRWAEVAGLTTLGLGRLQMARVCSAAGNLWFDAAYVEALDPPPRLRWGAWKTRIEYPDHTHRPLHIERCELYQAIAARLSQDP